VRILGGYIHALAMRNKFVSLFILIFSLLPCALSAQSTKDIEEEANYYFNGGEFSKAYPLFDKLYAKNPKNIDYKFKLGYCCLNYPEKKARAIEIFEDIKREGKSKDADFYLARAYHINYRFDDAAASYEAFLAVKTGKVKESEKQLIEEARHGIENCKAGKDLIIKKVKADIINIGAPINTDELEGVPVITTDESEMIFTYAGKKSVGGRLNDDLKPDPNGEYRQDIFISVKNTDSTWNDPVGITALNTKGNDAAVAISPDGSMLFTFQSSQEQEGDLYVSTLKGSEWTLPLPLNANINTEAWEGSCSMSADGRYLYFASERPGGLGGRDIWMSEQVNGDWGPPVNLGPNINTKYDEDAPFIHPDGITMFFSSKGHQSIGGYDIMFSIKKDGEWQLPRSMGMPLNTTEDDRYYVINAKGDKGYFSSDRGSAGGKGGQDIYMVTPGVLGEKPVIALLKGTVYGDDKPVVGKIEVVKITTSMLIGPYYSNSKTGKYLFALSPGYVYKIKVSAEGFDPVEEELDIESLAKYLEVKKDFYLYSPGKLPIDTAKPVPTTTVAAGPCETKSPPDLSEIKGKSLNIPEVYKKLLNIAGNYCAEGLIFKVQIAAYRKPENYKYNHLIEFGQPEIADYPDGITRFTQLQFKTIKEAEVQRQKAIIKGQFDAWIVAFYNGKRYTLEEFIMVDFLGKSVN